MQPVRNIINVVNRPGHQNISLMTMKNKASPNSTIDQELSPSKKLKVLDDDAQGTRPPSIHPFFSKAPQIRTDAQSISASTTIIVDNTHNDEHRIQWEKHKETLLTGVYKQPVHSKKIAAFDFDSTLVTTNGKHTFAKDGDDWKLYHASVPSKLRDLYNDGFGIVIISNQVSLGCQVTLEFASETLIISLPSC